MRESLKGKRTHTALITMKELQFRQQSENIVVAIATTPLLTPLNFWTIHESKLDYFLTHTPLILESSTGSNFTPNDLTAEPKKDVESLSLQVDEAIAEKPSPVRSALPPFPSPCPHVWNFSICYSVTYNSPTLYFTVSTISGQPLSHDQLLKVIPSDPPPSISHEEHPVTGTPSFFLHPCGTEKLLSLLKSDCELLSWLVIVLSSVGIRINGDNYVKLMKLIISMEVKQ